MPFLEEIQSAVEAVAARVGPAVAGLGRAWGRGSGVVVGPGLVLTNAHVLRGEEVAVTLGGVARHGRVTGVDLDLDVAVVAVDTGDAPVLEWAAAPPAMGAPVFAAADPGGRGLRVTFGLVSATDRAFRGPRGRRIAGSVEHTAPLPRGSSGSPLVDPEGRLLGLNTVRLDGGLILALPADALLRSRIDALARGEAPARPRLGLALAPPRASRRMRAAVGLPEREGLLVRAVQDGSPAAAAGIQRGDLLVAVEGRPLTGVDDLFDALEAAGDALALTLVRGTEDLEVPVPLAGPHFSK
jgi:S1-C subfamily serine protease